jgi:hypothetical protein
VPGRGSTSPPEQPRAPAHNNHDRTKRIGAA